MTPLEILERTFEPIDAPTSVPLVAPRAGIYLLVDGGDVVYVGSSAQVDHRLYAHVAALRTRADVGWFDRSLWLSLPVAVHPDYEGAFIRALRPRDNFRAPKHRGNDAEILDGFGLSRLDRGDAFARRRAQPSPGSQANSIAAARKRAGLTRIELAAALGVCHQSVHHWETGRRRPDSERLRLIASALDCPVSDLLPESN